VLQTQVSLPGLGCVAGCVAGELKVAIWETKTDGDYPSFVFECVALVKLIMVNERLVNVIFNELFDREDRWKRSIVLIIHCR
jgi:hypothetical protein